MNKCIKLDVEKLHEKSKDKMYECVFNANVVCCEDCPFYGAYCSMMEWLESLPTIEVSKDYISREYMLKLQRELHGWMPNDKSHKLWQKIKDAPSVVPSRAEGEWVDENGNYVP